jgi:hypothetical protein
VINSLRVFNILFPLECPAIAEGTKLLPEILHFSLQRRVTFLIFRFYKLLLLTFIFQSSLSFLGHDTLLTRGILWDRYSTILQACTAAGITRASIKNLSSIALTASIHI